MANNFIRQRRQAVGLTQRALADFVGTSQQQIQRVESGVQAARLDLAVAIAGALNAPLAEIFPELPQSQAEGRKSRGGSKKTPKRAMGDFWDAGIDPDPRYWTIKVGLRGGETILYSVSSREKERVSRVVWGGDLGFVVFDSIDKRIAIRCEGIDFCQFLFDVGLVEDNEPKENFSLKAFFLDGKAITFGVEPDIVKLEDDDDGLGAQLQNIFFSLDGDSGDEGVFWFDDEDAERVFIRKKHLLRLEVPLFCCEPALWKSSVENSEDKAEESGDGVPSGEQGA
jgi:transcriptional regulator with XRE-family HTH domain